MINLTMLGHKTKGMLRFAQGLLNKCEEQPNFKTLPISYVFAKGNFSSWNSVPGRKCYYVSDIFSVDKGKMNGLARYFLQPFILPAGTITFNPFYQGCIFQKNQIITVHDLIPLLHPDQNKFQYIAFKYLLNILLKKSLHIVAVSQTTKEAIIKFFHIQDSKITVIYNGVDTKTFYYGNKNNREKLLLVVGAHLPHKNIHEILEINKLWSSQYQLEIISGDTPYLIKLKELCRNYGIENKVKFTSWVDDVALAEKYQRASCLIFPSLEEGFGIPPLEAMSTGTPVILSDIHVHREVCAEAAIYIIPGDKQSWEKAFEVLDQKDRVEMHIQSGLKRAQLFSWQNSANRLTNLLTWIMPQKKSWKLD